MDCEIWKDIRGYEGLYRASDFGKIKSLRFNKEKILRQSLMGKYLCVSLYRDNDHKQFHVHRLILETFVGPCPKGWRLAIMMVTI